MEGAKGDYQKVCPDVWKPKHGNEMTLSQKKAVTEM